MAQRKASPKAHARALARHGRNGDTELAHLSADEIAILDSLQGGSSLNPITGLPEYFSLGKVFKNVAKAAGALVGGYLGGPAGAAIGGGVTSAIMGDSANKALTTGLLSGLGAYGVQQLGVGDALGIGGGFNSGADLLGRTGAQAASSGVASALGGGSKGGGGISSLLPLLGLGAAGAAAASYKEPKQPKLESGGDTIEGQEYEPLDRDTQGYAGDYYSYGVFGPGEAQFFDEVNPVLQPVSKAHGGRVHFKYGGNVSEGHNDREGTFGGGGERGGGNRDTQARDPAGPGGAISGGSGTGPGAKSYGGSPSGGAVGGTKAVGNATVADRMVIDKYKQNPNEGITTDKDFWDAVGNLGKRANDYANRGQGFMDDPLGAIGRTLGGVFGIGEMDPTRQSLGSSINTEDASWGVDPIGAALGLGGVAGAVPFGFGSIYNGIMGLTGQAPMIAFDGNNYLDADESVSGIGGWNSSPAGKALAGFTGGSGQTASGSMGPQIERQGEWKGPMVPQTAQGVPGGVSKPGTKSLEGDMKKPGGRTGDEAEDAAGRVYHPLANPYTYGQFGPEWTFFTGELPAQDLNMARGGGVAGPGTGQSDDIPAMLSDGEHVIDAETVSMIGDGSNKAGHQRIEHMKRKIRTKKRKAPANRIPPKTGGLSTYLKGAA